jgi:RNA polymerase sigma factor (sigma-70 family)
MTISPLRLLLIDDHEIIREGLRALVSRVPGWTVVGEAEDGIEGIRLAMVLLPDVVVTDMLMTGANGLEVARRLRAAGYKGGIVMLSAMQGEDLSHDAQAAGIDRLLPKHSSFGEFSTAIQAATQIKGSARVQEQRRNARPAAIESLTPRELDVLRLLARGRSSKEIGAELGISPRTVDVHRHRLQMKLKANGPAELTRIAVRAGIADL